ncbi:MAG TPA: spore germination protein [Bacillota bacterium]|nr:spore germination protein [Bacillota bacterium]
MNHKNKETNGVSETDLLTKELDVNLAELRRLLGASPDIVIREFIIGPAKNYRAVLLYMENLADISRIHEDILQPIADGFAGITTSSRSIFSSLRTDLLIVSDIHVERSFTRTIGRILTGDTAFFAEGLNEAWVFNTSNRPHRAVGIPETEISIRGPRESFVEPIATNAALLRRRISHSDLTYETVTIGRKTRTKVYIAYLKGVVNEKVVEEIRKRLTRIENDGILGAGYIEQLISDAPSSLFSTISYSERPDVVAAKILEGRAAILIDGTPEVLTAPALFIESFQSSDDYNFHPLYATLIRWIRYIAFGISILGPAFYIALSSFNQELIPTPLFITLAAGNEGTPYPTFVEVIIMGLLFEIFREAGIRLPRPFGQGLTFVLALIMAQAAISIGLAGVATVAVVAVTAIASLIVPGQSNASIIIRLALAILASFFGMYGILLGVLVMLAHLVSLRSFGVPYLAPIAPFNPRDFRKDVIWRAPLWAMLIRPRTIGWRNPRRQGNQRKPAPPEDDSGS